MHNCNKYLFLIMGNTLLFFFFFIIISIFCKNSLVHVCFKKKTCILCSSSVKEKNLFFSTGVNEVENSKTE